MTPSMTQKEIARELTPLVQRIEKLEAELERCRARDSIQPDAQTQQHLGQGHVNRGHGDKPGEKSDYSPDLEIGK